MKPSDRLPNPCSSHLKLRHRWKKNYIFKRFQSQNPNYDKQSISIPYPTILHIYSSSMIHPMHALRAVPLRTLQQLNLAAPCRAPVQFKSQLYMRTRIHSHSIYPRTFSTTGPTFQSLSPQPTSSPSAPVEITTGKLAAPRTTLPGDLEIPERLKDDSMIGYYFKVGKGYVRYQLLVVFSFAVVSGGGSVVLEMITYFANKM